MMKQPKMTLDEARAILHRRDKRKPGEHNLVLATDWPKRGRSAAKSSAKSAG
jgi:hypothetical protein